jgi:putative membrane protein
MSNLKRLLFGVFSLLLVLAILVFVLENQQSVSLLFLGWVGPQLPVSVVALVALLTGMVIGPLISVFVGRATRVRRKPIT